MLREKRRFERVKRGIGPFGGSKGDDGEPLAVGPNDWMRDEGQGRTMKGQGYSRNSTSVTPFLNRPAEQSRIDRSDIDPLA
uniref:DUF1604 domain-containing protein n=1 Tax=Panagrellus redivivus TaxID=6233 RepID=A0A7E4W8F7_PANRE